MPASAEAGRSQVVRRLRAAADARREPGTASAKPSGASFRVTTPIRPATPSAKPARARNGASRSAARPPSLASTRPPLPAALATAAAGCDAQPPEDDGFPDRLRGPARALAARRSPASPGSARRSTSSGSTTTSTAAPERRRRAWPASCGRCTAAASTTSQKYLRRARASCPTHLHWFKWEAYYDLAVRLRAAGASSTTRTPSAYLDRPAGADLLQPRPAIAHRRWLLLGGWLVYDAPLPLAARQLATGCSRRASCPAADRAPTASARTCSADAAPSSRSAR